MTPHLLEGGRFAVLPVCHYRVEFAQLVVAAFEQYRPDAVAVELPSALQTAVAQAVDRLPYLSVVAYGPAREGARAAAGRAAGKRGAGGRKGYLLVEPADPIVEAVRRARSLGLPVQCVDANLFDYPERDDRLPDPYAVMRIGHRMYFEEAERALFSREEPSDADGLREGVMAYRLAELARSHERVLLVCGMAHAARVARRAGEDAAPFGEHAEAGAQIDRDAVRLFDLHEASSRELMAEWPYLSAAYERARSGRGDRPAELPAPRIISFANRQRIEPAVAAPAAPADEPGLPVDRQAVAFALFRETAGRYFQDTGEEVKPHQTRVLAKFLRNYALVRGRLQPDLYQLIVAARGVVDDNYAYEVWDVSTHYPWQDPSGALPSLRLELEDLYDAKRTVRFHRRVKSRTKRPVLRSLRERKRENRPGEWAEAFDGSAICSYPPEDVVVERFGGFLRKKAKSVLAAENSRVEPFTTSLLDGIDVRETIRNWHEGKVYVRESRKEKGDVGSVVVVFDEDKEVDRYPWLMTWLGEHDDESDMALYSTDPADKLVGPGICRAEYGGFMMTYPPRRVADVWGDPYYRDARTKPEVLLMAAIDYSLERLVAYIAASPPRSWMKTFAARFGRKIVYIPIGQLSPVTMKKLRVFHVLSGYDKRPIAKEYIW